MAVYDRQIKLAKRLIAKYGGLTKVSVRESVIPDPTKPWEVSDSITEHENIRVAFFNLNKQNMESLTTMNASEVPKGAKLAYMGSVPFDVDLTTTFLFEGKTLSIYYMDVLAPNGEKVLYTMVLGE